MVFAHNPLEAPAVADYEAMFRLSPAAIALVSVATPSPRIVLANDAFRSMLGAGAEIEGRRIEQVFRGAAGAQLRLGFDQCLLGDDAVRLRVVHGLRGDVVRLYVELRRLAVAKQLFVLVAVSMPDRALALAELSDDDVLAELGALSRGLVYIHDVSRGRVRYGQHPLVELLGLPPGQAEDRAVHDLIHPDDRPRVASLASAQLGLPDGRLVTTTFRARTAAGGWAWVSVRSQVLARDRAGAVRRVIGVGTDVTEDHNHAAAMAAAASALAHAELKERRRIGRELHDSTAQTLVAARLGLETLQREAGLGPEASRRLEEVRNAVATAQAEIRNFSFMLHPPELEEQGLERTLKTFAEGFARRTGLEISVEVARGPWRLPFPVEAALFRVSQEALMNVYRHACAQTACVRLKRQRGKVVLEVEDDGVGLQASDPHRKPAGVGISGMTARMVQLGGALDVLPGAIGIKVRASVAAAPSKF